MSKKAETIAVDVDGVVHCVYCEEKFLTEDIITMTLLLSCPVKLHTLHHGMVHVKLQDKVWICWKTIRYDGLSDGFFCSSQHHAFTRNLLDL